MAVTAKETAQPGVQAPQNTRWWTGPFAIAALVYVAITVTHGILSLIACQGHFVYAVDDAYIALAMAKNLALHGVWGVTGYGFSGSSSSILFPLLTAGIFRVVGVSVYVPLVISWVAGLLSILVAARMLARFVSRTWQTLLLVLLVICAPLFVIGVIGMEHTLHLLFTLLFLEIFLPQDDLPAWRAALITALMVSARYEGLFFVAPACLLLLVQRRWKLLMAIAAGAALPVAGYAWFSVAHGSYWLPQSVALKGAHAKTGSAWEAIRGVLQRVLSNSRVGIWLVLLLAALAAAVISLARRTWNRTAAPMLLVLAAGCLHLSLASVQGMFRYEDYLIGSGIVAAGCAFPVLLRVLPRTNLLSIKVLFSVAGIVLLLRAALPGLLLPACTRAIYWQQMQMARFVQQYYPHASIAANDIGAISYFSDIHCFDVIGLASADVFYARHGGWYTTEFVEKEVTAQHVQIAIVYADLFTPSRPDPVGILMPANWTLVQRWSLPEQLQEGGRTVSFYAVAPGEAEPLRHALQQFRPTLPHGVIVTRN